MDPTRRTILRVELEDVVEVEKTFSMLSDADMKFPKVSDGNGGLIELTHGNYIKLLENKNRDIRKTVFGSMYDAFGKLRNTFATTLDGDIKKDVLNAKLRIDTPSPK